MGGVPGLIMGVVWHASMPNVPLDPPAPVVVVGPRIVGRYLTRSVPSSARYLDHGVIALGVAGGYPHLYRLHAALGLFDHLTLGVTAHWLPAERLPRWRPWFALAFYRGERVEVGARYLQALASATPHERGPAAHWILAALTFSYRWLSGGFDVGLLRSRGPDPSVGEGSAPLVSRWHLGGGLHLRAGTRRWGFIAQGLAPHLSAELVFEVRLGAFELRPRGGWVPRGHSWAGDRPRPTLR